MKREKALLEKEIISKAEAIKTMLRSGYLLESRISALLRGRGWVVESNSAYMDPITGKSRELDVHGIGGASIYDDERGNAFVFQHLLIECVNSPQPVLFISSEQMMNDRKVELIKEISDPPLVFDDGYFEA